NPLAGRAAWSGSSGGYINAVVNLGPNVSGQNIVLRFRMGTDTNTVFAPGWRIDTLSIVNACPTPTPTPTPVPTATPTATATATATITPTPTPPAQPVNLSTRMLVQTGEGIGIGGFIITGTAP